MHSRIPIVAYDYFSYHKKCKLAGEMCKNVQKMRIFVKYLHILHICIVVMTLKMVPLDSPLKNGSMTCAIPIHYLLFIDLND